MVSKEGNKVIAVLPERTSSDRIHLLKALGVEIIRTPTEARREAAENMYSTAYKLSEQLQNSIVIDEVRLESKTTRFAYHRSNMFVTVTLTRILLS
jgi:cystathionine beta-synthase